MVPGHVLLPDSLLLKIVGQYIAPGDAFPVALTCRSLRGAAMWKGGGGGSSTHFKTPTSTVVVSVPMLAWAVVTCGYRWSAMTCGQAARGGHLTVLQWARANGCEWDAQVCAQAAGGGHLTVLQWALANGYECDARMCTHAARGGGHLTVVQWLRATR